jgi:dynactin complex subunit
MSLQYDEDANVNKKLSVYKHIKKKAANDAQLLMNRIALIQKEEERARKKIEQTKERAVEILALRSDTQKRVKAYKNASRYATSATYAASTSNYIL